MKLSAIRIAALAVALNSCGDQGAGNNSMAAQKRAPIFTLSPTEFSPGQAVAAHAGMVQGDLPGNHQFSCGDPQHPTRLVWSDPTYDFALVQLKDDGTTADIPSTGLRSNLVYQYAPGWREFDFPPINTPAALPWPKIRAVFGFFQYVRSGGGNACAPKLAYKVLRSHDYHRTCAGAANDPSRRCSYVPDEPFTG